MIYIPNSLKSERKCLLSVVIPFHNAASTISNTLDSVLTSALKAHYDICICQWLEIILIDNASCDNSINVINEYFHEKELPQFASCVFCNEPNLGVSNARNKGLILSHGCYLAFIDADDIVSTEYFSEIIYGISLNVSLIYLYSMNIDARSLPFLRRRAVICVDEFINRYLHGWWCCAFIVKKSLLEDLYFWGDCYEDVGFYPFVLARSRDVYLISSRIYFYKNTISSLTNRGAIWRSYAWRQQFNHIRDNVNKLPKNLYKFFMFYWLKNAILLNTAAGIFPVLGVRNLVLYFYLNQALSALPQKVLFLFMCNLKALYRSILMRLNKYS